MRQYPNKNIWVGKGTQIVTRVVNCPGLKIEQKYEICVLNPSLLLSGVRLVKASCQRRISFLSDIEVRCSYAKEGTGSGQVVWFIVI